MAHPQRQQLKLNLSARELLHVKTVAKLILGETIVAGDNLGSLRRRLRLYTTDRRRQQKKCEDLSCS